MKILGIYGSPRKGGNTDTLLDEALKSAESCGAEVSTIRVCDLNISGCIECGSCDDTGECVVDDDMNQVYPRLLEADAIVLAAPMFFYSVPAQAKALIDRCQAMWCKRMLEKTREKLRSYDSGKGYFIAVGATKGATLFDGTKLLAKYWYDALDMSFEDGLYLRSVEKMDAIKKLP
ncbi:flavodoxin family protein, partial [Thermodesulfobacteriota bacterium]